MADHSYRSAPKIGALLDEAILTERASLKKLQDNKVGYAKSKKTFEGATIQMLEDSSLRIDTMINDIAVLMGDTITLLGSNIEAIKQNAIDQINNSIAQGKEITDKQIKQKLYRTTKNFLGGNYTFKNLLNGTYYDLSEEIKKQIITYLAKKENTAAKLVQNKEAFLSGKLIEEVVIDTTKALYESDKNEVKGSPYYNSPYDFTISGINYEVKTPSVNNFRFGNFSMSRYYKDISPLIEEAVKRYTSNIKLFDARDFQYAVIAILIGKKLRDNGFAPFIAVNIKNKNALEYLLASDFLSNILNSNGGVILDHNSTKIPKPAMGSFDDFKGKKSQQYILWYSSKKGIQTQLFSTGGFNNPLAK